MTASEQRKRVRIVVSAAAMVSVTLTVWVIYFVRTRQYLVLAQLPSFSLVMGLVLTSVAVFLGAKAVREQSWPRDARLHLLVRATPSLLFALTLLLHASGAGGVQFVVQMVKHPSAPPSPRLRPPRRGRGGPHPQTPREMERFAPLTTYPAGGGSVMTKCTAPGFLDTRAA